MRADSSPVLALINRFVNPPLARLLRTGLGGRTLGRTLALIDYTGRRSGQRRRLVTMYNRDDHTITIPVAAAGRKSWWRNFDRGGPMRILLRGRHYDATARAVVDRSVRVIVDLPRRAGSDPPA